MAKLTKTQREALLWFGWGEFTNDTAWMITPRYVYDYGTIQVYPYVADGDVVTITGHTIEQLIALGLLSARKVNNQVHLRLAGDSRGTWIRAGARVECTYQKCEWLRRQLVNCRERVDTYEYRLNRRLVRVTELRRSKGKTLAAVLAADIRKLEPTFRAYRLDYQKRSELERKLAKAMKWVPTEDELTVFMVSTKLDDPDKE